MTTTERDAAPTPAVFPETLRPLLVCGQGTYHRGHFYAEYHERDLYLKHILATESICREFGYNVLVCSGSYTKSQTPSLSEAESMESLWDELERHPRSDDGQRLPWLLEEAAQDTAQNVVFGLMRLRLALREADRGEQPFSRIGVWTVWKYKRNRHLLLADALGIESQVYFHGLAHAEESTDGANALDSEKRQVDVLRQTQDPLMMARSWHHKRGFRDANPDARARHLETLRQAFPRCFSLLDGDAWSREPEPTNAAFREAFQAEVMRGQT